MSRSESASPDACYVWEPGVEVGLSAEAGDTAGRGAVDLVSTLVEGLFAAVQPLLVGAAFGCDEHATSSASTDVFATLRQEPLPPQVRRREYDLVDHENSAVSLTPDVVRDWLGDAFDRCRPGGRPVLRRLEAPSTRALLISAGPADDGFPLLAHPDGPRIADIPIETEAGDRWLYAPVESVSVEPPVTYRVVDHYGSLRAAVTISWSWWFEPGHAEYDNLRALLQQLGRTGWSHDPMPGAHDHYGLGTS